MRKDQSDSALERVKQLIKEYPETGENDKLLFLAYLVIHFDLRKKLGEEAYLELKKILLEAPSFETLRRHRQKLQSH